jgi:GNAT superfamily N-acetyltransferase
MIQAITRDEVLNGLGQDYHCCMFGSSRHAYQCTMWPRVFDEIGGIGYLARDDAKLIGQLIFLPKHYACRIGTPTAPQNGNLERTLVISCLYVMREYAGRGIASAMISATLEFCRTHGFSRVEAVVDRRPPPECEHGTSFFPFRKFGFVLDDSREGWECWAHSRICHLDMPPDGSQVAAAGTCGI